MKITDISSGHIVIINGVDPNIKYENNTTTLNHIREVYGIFKIERITNSRDEPTNMYRAYMKNIKMYIELLKNKTIMKEPKNHKHFHAKPCRVCGSLDHKKCERQQKCLKCTGTDHQLMKCESRWFSGLNCGKNHPTDSEICDLLTEETYRINTKLLTLLIGEGLILNKAEILDIRFKERSTPTVNSKPINISSGLDLNSEQMKLVDERFKRIEAYVIKHETEQNSLAARVNHLNQHISDIDNKVDAIHQGLKTDMNELKTDMNELKKGIKTEMDAMSRNLANEMKAGQDLILQAIAANTQRK